MIDLISSPDFLIYTRRFFVNCALLVGIIRIIQAGVYFRYSESAYKRLYRLAGCDYLASACVNIIMALVVLAMLYGCPPWLKGILVIISSCSILWSGYTAHQYTRYMKGGL